MVPRGHAKHIQRNYPTQAECGSQEKARPTETTSPCFKMKLGSHRQGQQTDGNKLHPRSLLPRLARQHRLGKKGKWEIEDVRRLHGPKQGLPKRQLSPAKNRLTGEFHSRT